MYLLSEGSLESVMSGEELGIQPIFQILAIKKLTNFANLSEDTNRYRLKISDGRTLNSFIMLGTPLNHLVQSNVLTEYSIVRINKHVITEIKNNGQQRSVMVILKMDVLIPGYQVGKVIGSDISFIEEKFQFIDIDD